MVQELIECCWRRYGNRYWMNIEAFDKSGKPAAGVPLQDGWFEITLPKAILDEGNRVRLGWIDFYRG